MKDTENIKDTKMLQDDRDKILEMIESLPSREISEYNLEHIGETIEEANTELGDSDIFYDVQHRINMLTRERRRSDAENPSGYYKIKAKMILEELDGDVTFHRGKGLPDLFKDETMNDLLFSEASRKEIEEKNDGLITYPQTILHDIFAQHEVADVIEYAYPEVMDISITPVAANSIDHYFSVCHIPYDDRPTHFQQTKVNPSDCDLFSLTIRWSDESRIGR